MGIYSRYSAAFLVLALLSPQAFSAVRVPVVQNSEYIKQVLARQNATTGAVTTPAGDVAFFGADKVYSFATGDSVAPTIREVKSAVGTPSFPYGPGAAYPSDPAYSPANATKLKVKPQIVVPKANILTALKNGLKTNPGQLVLTATVAAAVGAVGWVMSDDQTKLQKKQDAVDGIPVAATGSFYPNYICGVLPASQTMNKITVVQSGGATYAVYVGPYQSAPSGYVINNNCTQSHLGYWYNSNGYWPQSAQRLISVEEVVSLKTDLADSDLSSLDPWVSQQSATWLGGLIKDVCDGSLNPGKCYDTMVDRSKGMISGPALLAGPITSKTTSTMNPDGSLSTKTDTTKTDFKIGYGKDYFDVTTEKKTTTTKDGELVSETTEKDDTPVTDPADSPQESEEPEPEYVFNDSPFPEVDPFYEQKYPDGLEGVWDQAKSDIDSSNFLGFLRSFVPSFSGSCPSFGMSFAIGNMANLGSHEFQSLCYVFDFVKIIIMVSAAFLARQITFGG